ncbi:hypothetical protein HPB50_000068 [Hyalomma asiaticum]|uniref:Uncharacterized protein n=1 Tax=Hyalomma asiaticum TaxID=266040 RepID=A0ACB7T2W9_HYAAI|nr:hypothetical protein HPB50_000068 [Hyalomma asiaticum]
MAQNYEFENIQAEHTLVEVLPERKTQKSLFVVNAYSPPRDQLPDFDHLIHDIKKLTNGHQVVLVGDFNASHAAWGYQHTTRKGARVHDAAQNHGLTLSNDLLQNTRIGNSVSRDTNPDHTFTTGTTWVEWSVLPDTLGSDRAVESRYFAPFCVFAKGNDIVSHFFIGLNMPLGEAPEATLHASPYAYQHLLVYTHAGDYGPVFALEETHGCVI